MKSACLHSYIWCMKSAYNLIYGVEWEVLTYTLICLWCRVHQISDTGTVEAYRDDVNTPKYEDDEDF